MNISKSYKKIVLVIFVFALSTLSYELYHVWRWAKLINPDMQSIKEGFGEPVSDVGSGIYIYLYKTPFGAVYVGSSDRKNVLYIKYLGYDIVKTNN